MEIYKECAKKPFSFLTTDTNLPASNPQRFSFNFIKMTVTDQIKILDDKIKSSAV